VYVFFPYFYFGVNRPLLSLLPFFYRMIWQHPLFTPLPQPFIGLALVNGIFSSLICVFLGLNNYPHQDMNFCTPRDFPSVLFLPTDPPPSPWSPPFPLRSSLPHFPLLSVPPKFLSDEVRQALPPPLPFQIPSFPPLFPEKLPKSCIRSYYVTPDQSSITAIQTLWLRQAISKLTRFHQDWLLELPPL